MKKYTNISAVILAGGKSSRMGEDKGLVRWKGKALVEHVLTVVQPMFEEVIIVANDLAYNNFKVKVVQDEIKHNGPLFGICTGLKASKNDHTLVLSCDNPLVSADLIVLIANKINNTDCCLVSHNNALQPFPGLYSKNCLPHFTQCLANNNGSIIDAIKGVDSLLIQEGELPTDYQDVNMNSKQDLINYDSN